MKILIKQSSRSSGSQIEECTNSANDDTSPSNSIPTSKSTEQLLRSTDAAFSVASKQQPNKGEKKEKGREPRQSRVRHPAIQPFTHPLNQAASETSGGASFSSKWGMHRCMSQRKPPHRHCTLCTLGLCISFSSLFPRGRLALALFALAFIFVLVSKHPWIDPTSALKVSLPLCA
ncbi:hypothetical protein BD289DRAFT_430150 [Coniella lustricola]|uniref:Uncharacterized protein n=1 Tax=Coniella lustricola TaxID=2025994 RepID=A0A2T3ACC6_9PEZI|nr:hypothetical protein BD289DRAFT_430150 [Coniella lustricola]